jgi:hypothetical protein
MGKKKNVEPKNYNVATMQPDELKSLKALVEEFVEKLTNIDNEVELLKEDRKSLIEEYSEKLDYKTLVAALKVVKIKSEVVHKDTFDMFVDVLTDPS